MASLREQSYKTLQVNDRTDLIDILLILWNNRHNIDNLAQLLHLNSRVILFKKTPMATTWDKLRPISICPAWLVVVEKTAVPLIIEELEQHLHTEQYGFLPGKDTILARLRANQAVIEKRLKESLLLDIRKAYDSVNLDKLQTIIEALEINQQVKNFLISLINAYKAMFIVIEERYINATRGLPQGAPLSPLLFNVYINSVLVKGNSSADSIGRVAAYADDIIIQAENQEHLKTLFNMVNQELEALELKLNPSKTVYLADENTAPINILDTQIQPTKDTKYLGQQIDFNGRDINTIISSDYIKMMKILKSGKELSRMALVKIFKLYVKSKFTHLIPTLIHSNKIEETWKNIKAIAFKHVLKFATLPLESRSLLKIGYYHIMVRPILKIYSKQKIQYGNTSFVRFLNMTLKKTLAYWLVAEPKMMDLLKQGISEFNTEQLSDTNLELWDKAVQHNAVVRLANRQADEENINLPIKMYPNTLQVYSRAFYHIVQDAVIAKWKKPNTASKQKEIILKAMKTITFSRELLKENLRYSPETLARNQIYSTTEQIALVEANIAKETKRIMSQTIIIIIIIVFYIVIQSFS